MTGDNHAQWEVFTDDPYWIRRLEKMGIQPFAKVGFGFKYKLSADQVLIRKGKRHVSEAQRERLRHNAHFGVKNPSPTAVFAT
jgi:hypothetical protein